MDQIDNPPRKSSPKPSKQSIDIAKYFELQLVDIAIKAYKKKEYLKSAMMSWSFIEEFFLPTSIEFIASNQKIIVPSDILGANAFQLIRYYFLISYDEELYKILEKARELRNALIHKSYKSGSIDQIAKKAKESSEYNLFTVLDPCIDRLSGKVTAPSLTLYSRGWNDYREKTREMLDARIKELKSELNG